MTRTREYNVVIERDQNGRFRASLDEQPDWVVEAGTLEELSRHVDLKLSQMYEMTPELVLPTKKIG